MSTRAGTDDAAPVVWDVFVSYSRADAQRAGFLVSALRAHGLRVFVDESAVDDFSSISAAIAGALARSRALLTVFSTDYPRRRACQWELTFAYLSGQWEGDPRRRVLVINPEFGTEHIHPVELRDARHWPWPTSPEASDHLARRVATHVAELTSPMGGAAADGFVRWLPAPARAGSARFTGRFTEQWRVHSALHQHRTPLVGHSFAGRSVQLRGMPGVGKSLLAQEYALRFRPAFPGGVFWFDLHGTRTPDETVEAYAEQVTTVANALGLRPTARAGLAQLLSTLAVELGARNSHCLWVVDGLPDGLSPEQLHLLRGPHLLAATLVTTRSLRYTAFAESIDLSPLPDADALHLLTARRSPRGDADQAAATALVHDVGGHPRALDLLAELGARHGFVHVRDRLHSSDTDLLAGAAFDDLEAMGDLAPRDVGSAGGTPRARSLAGANSADDVLRLFALACPAPLHATVVEHALGTLNPYDPWDSSALVTEAVDTLLGAGLLCPDPGLERSWTVHALLARAVRRHDTDAARQEDLRRALLHALSSQPVAPGGSVAVATTGRNGSRADRDGPRSAGTPGAVERAAAFDLQVELVTRVGVQTLAPDEGSLREALTSLRTLVGTAREVLHRVSSQTAAPLRLPGIAAQLTRRVRAFLSRWHPALEEYEAERPPGVSHVAHERGWARATEMRSALGALRAPLVVLAEQLALLSGADLSAATDASAVTDVHATTSTEGMERPQTP